MTTRQARKTQLYNTFFQEERNRLRSVDAAPNIRGTAFLAQLSKVTIPEYLTTITFRESKTYRGGKFFMATVMSNMTILAIFGLGRGYTATHNMSVISLLIIAIVVSWMLTMKINKDRYLEISSAGITAAGRSLTWNEIMGTYMLRRSGRYETYKLILLLDSGEVLRVEMKYFEELFTETLGDISKYIEHFKSRIPGW